MSYQVVIFYFLFCSDRRECQIECPVKCQKSNKTNFAPKITMYHYVFIIYLSTKQQTWHSTALFIIINEIDDCISSLTSVYHQEHKDITGISRAFVRYWYYPYWLFTFWNWKWRQLWTKARSPYRSSKET